MSSFLNPYPKKLSEPDPTNGDSSQPLDFILLSLQMSFYYCDLRATFYILLYS